MLNERQEAALNRLTKKLSALRKTLRGDERQMLDLLIAGKSEVSGHAAVRGRRQAVTDEVTGHAMDWRLAKRGAVTDEVAGHAMQSAVQGAAVGAAQGAVQDAAAGAASSAALSAADIRGAVTIDGSMYGLKKRKGRR